MFFNLALTFYLQALVKRIFGLIQLSGRVVVTNFLNRYADIFEYFIQSFSIMAKSNGSVMREIALDQYMAVETTHFRNGKNTDGTEGTCCYRKDFTVCDVSSQYIV